MHFFIKVSLCLVILTNENGISSGFFFNWQNENNQDSEFSQMPSTRFVRQQQEDNDNDINDIEDSETIKCFDELGCIENTPEFFSIPHRPFNLLPFDRHKVNTRFILFHRGRTVDPTQVYLKGPHLLEEGFDPAKPVKFITHGFLDTGFSYWMTKLAQTLLLAGDFNVIAVDWGGGSLSLYTQATANTRLVALEIAQYMEFLNKEFGIKFENIHCIGHSLGAHVCGYVGQKVKRLGRITGLDPAQPYFQYLPDNVRLSPDDARFVDIVHSDGRTLLLLGLGMSQPCGHMDFYPNDGQNQPGCDLKEIPTTLMSSHGYEEAERDVFACNHHRAIYYWQEATLGRCPWVGHICQDYASYLRGDCYSCGDDGSNCALMGLNADKYKIGNRSMVPFYVSTAALSPFCVRHYRVSIQLGAKTQKRSRRSRIVGKLRMSIMGSRSSIDEINLSPNEHTKLENGMTISFMVQNPKDLGSIKRVKVSWKSEREDSNCHMCTNKLLIENIKIINIDNIPSIKSQMSSTTLCSQQDGGEAGGVAKMTVIGSGSSAKFDVEC